MDVEFIQVGLRRNGRIKKNEQFTLSKFIKKVFTGEIKKIKSINFNMSLFDRLSNKKVVKKLNETFFAGYDRGYISAYNDFLIGVKQIIKLDKESKKRK